MGGGGDGKHVHFISGAELFAKRRKRSEKWVVGETNGAKQENLPDIAPLPTPLLSPLPPLSTLPPPSYLPETTQRMQHNLKLDEIQVLVTLMRCLNAIIS